MKLIHKLLLREDHICPWWLAYTFDNPVRRLFHKPEQILGAYLQKGMKVVDIGCGMGYFSIAMAELVGEQGRVIAVDIQQRMLDVLARRASAKGVKERIHLHCCNSGVIALDLKVDFALTFWMVHEVSNIVALISQVRYLLNAGGKYLLVEPRFHVSAERFRVIARAATSVGFEMLDRPKISFSRSVLFQNPDQTS